MKLIDSYGSPVDLSGKSITTAQWFTEAGEPISKSRTTYGSEAGAAYAEMDLVTLSTYMRNDMSNYVSTTSDHTVLYHQSIPY